MGGMPSDQAGACPSCGYEGPIGAPCAERVCARRGYHFVPPEFAGAGRGPHFNGDPMVGLSVGDYLIVGRLGAGGFGTVYLALQTPILMKSALKLMNRAGMAPELGDTLLRKFRDEAMALARLSHPNIVRLLKYGQHEGMPYLVMEYVSGGRTLAGELRARVDAGQPMSSSEIRHLLDQLLNGLGAAHDAGIIHRDIKPGNIMLQSIRGDANFVRIGDFGLAKFAEARTQTTGFAGTPMYFAPEQVRGGGVGPWTDLYAVGVIAFEMLAQRRPFDGGTFEEILIQKVWPEYDPTAGLEGLTHLPPITRAVFRRALAMDPEQRFQRADELRRALDPILDFMAADETPGPTIEMPRGAVPAPMQPTSPELASTGPGLTPAALDSAQSQAPRKLLRWVALLLLAAAVAAGLIVDQAGDRQPYGGAALAPRLASGGSQGSEEPTGRADEPAEGASNGMSEVPARIELAVQPQPSPGAVSSEPPPERESRVHEDPARQARRTAERSERARNPAVTLEPAVRQPPRRTTRAKRRVSKTAEDPIPARGSNTLLHDALMELEETSEPAGSGAQVGTRGRPLAREPIRAQPQPPAPSAAGTARGAESLTIPNAVVNQIMRRASVRIRKCVTDGGHSGLILTVAFQIHPRGTVTHTSIQGRVTQIPVLDCVRSVVNRLVFPPFVGPAPRSVRYPVTVPR